MQCNPYTYGTNRRKRFVKLHLGSEFNGNVYQQTALNTLNLLRTHLINNASYFVELQQYAGASFDIQISINHLLKFECSNQVGQSMSNLLPPINIFNPDAVPRLVERITHIAKFYDIRDVENPNRQSALANKIRIEVVAVQNPLLQYSATAGISEVMDGRYCGTHPQHLSVCY